MNITYLSCILFLLTAPISKTMQVDFTTMITFNGKEKSLYEWIRDRDKAFGNTPLYDMSSKNNKDRYVKINRVKTIKDNELKGIARGLYIYCPNFKIKTINSKKSINYGALAAIQKWPNIVTRDTSTSFTEWTPITPEIVKIQSNSLYLYYLKKSFEKKEQPKTDKIITNKSIV